MYIQANYTGPGLEETFPGISTISPFPWFTSVPFSLIIHRSPHRPPILPPSLSTLSIPWISTVKSPTSS